MSYRTSNDPTGGGGGSTPWGGIIGGVAQIGSTYIQSRTARRNTDATNQANRELAEYAYAQDLEQWHRQNEYNSPAEQMKRFAEAGLNPHLMYGHGTPGNAQQMPQYHAPRQEYNYRPEYDPATALNEFMNLRMKETNIASTEAGIELQKQQVEVQKAVEAMNWANYHGVIQENTIRSVETYIHNKMMNHMLDGAGQRVADQRWLQKEADAVISQLNRDIKAWEKSLTDQGLNPRDNILYRQLAETLDAIGFSPEQIRRALGQQTKKHKK